VYSFLISYIHRTVSIRGIVLPYQLC